MRKTVHRYCRHYGNSGDSQPMIRYQVKLDVYNRKTAMYHTFFYHEVVASNEDDAILAALQFARQHNKEPKWNTFYRFVRLTGVLGNVETAN